MVNKAYHGGAFFSVIGNKFSNLKNFKKVISADVLDAWFEPSPKVTKKLRKHLSNILKTSPPAYSEGLVETISKYRKIPKENILTLAGSSNVMYALFLNIISKKDKVLIIEPTYSEYTHIFKNVIGNKYIKHNLIKENEFKIDSEKFLKDIKKHKPKMVVLVNPNSPTGKYWKKSEIKKFLKKIPKSTLVAIDETYIDYVGKSNSLEQEVKKYKNLIIIKSMSKVYALSGARVGYLVADKKIIEKISRFVPPWSVSLLAQVSGVEALKDEKYYFKKYKKTHKLREEMFKELTKLDSIVVYNSVANFLLIELKGKISADFLINKLKNKNIFIRKFKIGLKSNFVRIAIKNRRTNKIIIKELKNILKN